MNAWVKRNRPLASALSPFRNTRSHGTTTSSNTATASISSKRVVSGESAGGPPVSKLSRQMNDSPGTDIGTAKAKA